MLLLLPAALASADHTPLPDTITTPNVGYDVGYDNDNPWAPPLAAGDDRNYFPTAQAQNVANALDNSGANTTGNPNGYHAGYTDIGFPSPDFNGSDRPTFVFDCAAHGGCDSGNAPSDRINMPTVNGMMYVTATEPCLRLVMGHELFHHVQYAYITFGKWSAWGEMPVEGTARMMQDKIYSDIDGDAGCITYRGEVKNYMDNPNRTIWDTSYTSALWWNYASEQLGTTTTEPIRGTDFIRQFWVNAQAANDDPNTPAAFRETVRDFDASLSVEELFHRFSIANVAREYDVSLIPEAIQYSYRDEADGVSGAYSNIVRTFDGNVGGGIGPTATSVQSLGARYFEGDLDVDCQGIAGYRAVGDNLAHGLLAVGPAGRVQRVFKSQTDDFAAAFVLREDPAERLTNLVAVAAGMGSDADFDYSFACGQAGLQIVRPDATYQAYVGESTDPERFIVRMIVTGPTELGTPTVFGLDPADFTVYVGPVAPENEATVLSGSNVQGEYWLVVQAPTKAANATFDLTVLYGDLTQDSETNAVLYEKRILDQMLVVDRSGSMLSPSGSPKLEAAKNAARLYVDAAGSDDLIGLVSFGGDNVEPNDDATLDSLLLSATDVHRTDTKSSVDGISTIPSVLTSIGDGLEKARQEYLVRGSALGEDWIILLSDGMENEALYYSNVKASLVADGIQVHTIALGPSSDQALLQQIATDTGGTYYYVDEGTVAAAALSGAFSPMALGASIGASAPLANRLADAYASAFEAARNTDRIWEVEDVVSEPNDNQYLIKVGEAGLVEGRFAFNWDDPADDVNVEIVDPFGNPLVDGVGGNRFFSDATHAEWHLDTLSQGDWTVTVTGVKGTTDYIGILSGRINRGVNMDLLLAAELRPDVVAQGGTFAWGQRMPLQAVLTDSLGPISGANVIASILHPDGTTIELPIFDDGNHGDGQPNDGVYGNVYTRTTEASPTGLVDGANTPRIVGSYNVRFEASGESNYKESFSRIGKRSFHAFEILDPDADTDSDGMPDVYENYHDCIRFNVADGGTDPDADGLPSADEWKIGTSPCHADTDFGGEMDSSEVNRGANPFDPADDLLPRPEDPQVLTGVPDHTEPYALQSGRNLLRYPSSPLYQSVRIWRSLFANGPFAIIDEFTPDGTGIYPDDGLTNGLTYYYRVQGIGLSGQLSNYSRTFSGTPKADPVSTTGAVEIAGGAAYIPKAETDLALSADAADTVEMQISNDNGFPGAPWVPYATTASWTLNPDPGGYAIVYARFRDPAGNVSRTYFDDARVVGTGSIGDVVGVANLEGASDHTGITIEVTAGGEINPQITPVGGGFGFFSLLAGTYDLRASRDGYETVDLPNVIVTAGATTDVGQFFLPEPTLGLMLMVGSGGLASLARRRRGRRPPS